jgi:hypothetical protein
MMISMWDVEVTDQFKDWWDRLTEDQQESVTDRVKLLAERGPTLVDLSSTRSRLPDITV